MSLVVPAACTLPTAERPVRLAEFDDLFATAVRSVGVLDATHVRMQLSGSTGLGARVRDLTAREAECCSFFTFTITPGVDGEAVALDIEVPAKYADVLASLAQRASAVSAGATS